MNIPKNTPLFVSFPRSGCMWIQAIMEIYFDAPRGPNQTGGLTWRPPKKNEKFMWFHTHDRNLKQEKSNIKTGDIFLYRNPVDAIYSLVNGPDASRKDHLKEAFYFKSLLKKWTSKAKTILTYEEMINRPFVTLQKINKHFNRPWNEQNAKLAIETCSKENILTKGDKVGSKWHNTKLIKKQYIENRKIFYEKNAKKILNIIEDEKTRPFLEKIIL